MKYIYEVAGIKIGFDLPYEMKITKESKQFLYSTSNFQNIDLQLCFENAEEIELLPKDGFWQITQYHVNMDEKWRIYHCPSQNQPAEFCVEKINDQTILCRYAKNSMHRLQHSQNIVELLNIEILMLHFKSMILHSSYIHYKQEGILFSAPSGTGKSTQADLWVKYEGARIINGDKSGIRYIEDQWVAYGLPYAGSSSVYLNEHFPLKCIVVLKQAKENSIKKLSAREAFPYLYSQITIHHYDESFVNQCLDLITELIMDVPIYLLSCTPDQRAVNLLKETLYKEDTI